MVVGCELNAQVKSEHAVESLETLDSDATAHAVNEPNCQDKLNLVELDVVSSVNLLDYSNDQRNEELNEYISTFFSTRFSPDIIDRYPLQDQREYGLPEGIPLFCFPEGCAIAVTVKSPIFFSFISTSVDGTRLLGSCLRFYELASTEIRAYLVNKWLHHTRSCRNMEVRQWIDRQQLFVPKSICIISNWPFSQAFKQVLCSFYQLTLYGNQFSGSASGRVLSLNSPQEVIAPLERYICNFIDDVPAPPWGRFDVIYYLPCPTSGVGEQSVSFRCPPFNEPNAWSSFPLCPLFECLAPLHVLDLFNLVLTERQVVLVSSQLSLLTACSEAITSLLYPITWAHGLGYIPVLPLQLIGVLAAPFPFLVGIPASFLKHPDCIFGSETVRVFLDHDNIEYGPDCTPLAPLPDRRARKLLQLIETVAPVFRLRGERWIDKRLPFFDAAFSSRTNQEVLHIEGKSLVDETAVRAGFLKFFVAILKNYRK